ncbi:MAG: hypothetical protein IIX39_06180 [Clostridia bacterium]|nr:hypothetical protein [Clostridia bacterium]
MGNFLKFIGAIVALAGIAAGIYFAVTKFFLKYDEFEDCDEICCFDEDEVEIEDVAEETVEEEKTEE